MKLALRMQYFLATVTIVLVSMFAADAYLTTTLDRSLTARIGDDLRARLALVARLAGNTALSLDDLAGWPDFASTAGREARARVSVIRADGTLIGDSNLDAAGLERAENHAQRPEVQRALAGAASSDTRLSTTLHERMLYLATPLTRAGATAGVVRLALPLTEVDAAVAAVHHLLLVATVIALVLAVALSGVVSRWASRRAWQLASAARRMAEGDLSTRTHSTGADELGELGKMLDRLAASLSSTLNELRSQRDVLGGVLDGMQEGVLLVDHGGAIRLVNPALREMLLLGADSAGKPLHQVVRDPELAKIFERARGAREPVVGEIDVAGLKPRRLLVRGLALAGEPGGILVVFVDVTELRRLEKLRRDFVANVSHELRTPVTAVRSATETLQDAATRDPEAVPMFVDIIARNADRMHRLVEDLLDLSRIESREYRLELEAVDLLAVVPLTFELFQDRAARKSIRLVSEIPRLMPAVHADRRALEQILTNLLENAIKYCAEDAQIRIGAVMEGERFIRILVTDSGPGIEAKHLPRLFERFYRVDKGRARDVGGTGLGLSIVKHLSEAMGGEVGVESKPGEGSTFHVTLPRATETQAGRPRDASEPLDLAAV